MSLSPLPGFVALTTDHCVTGSLRHVYAFHNYPISEDLLLGLGAGVGFIYWQTKGIPPFFGGRANVGRPGEKGLEIVAGERTGVVVASHATSSARTAERTLLELLDAGEPVMVNLDMGYLPYFGLPEGYHFGGHAVVVAGYDAASAQALLADRDGVLHPVPLATLAEARGSTYKPFPPRNAWYTFDFANARPPRADEVRLAIREVVEPMLHPPIANFGVRGIRTAAARVRGWPKAMSADDVRLACWSIPIYIEPTGGTGGGIFRYMYARFLLEAAEIMGEPRLGDVAARLRDIGDRWQAVAALFTAASEAPDPAPALAEASSALLAVADMEQAAWEELQALVASP